MWKTLSSGSQCAGSRGTEEGCLVISARLFVSKGVS